MTDTVTLERIDAETLRSKINSNDTPIVINALNQEAYMAKHIPGSINIPAENADLAEKVIPYKKSKIVVYCANTNCTASPNLAQNLEDMGYTNVRDFEEGLAGWKKAGYELIGNEA